MKQSTTVIKEIRNVQQDLNDIQEMVKDSKRTLRRIMRALNGK